MIKMPVSDEIVFLGVGGKERTHLCFSLGPHKNLQREELNTDKIGNLGVYHTGLAQMLQGTKAVTRLARNAIM